MEIFGLPRKLFPEDLQETGVLLEDNALQKAEQVYAVLGANCFADDTGLEVDSLQGRPGVLSARYAGPQRNDRDNMAKLLEELRSSEKREARFRTVIALIWNGQRILFEGWCKGHIAREKRGDSGFGYDPIFVPEGETRTFAEMNLEEKNRISHRAMAIEKLTEFLKQKMA
jgi:XTP/dITP diphosphohydrolase